MEFFKALLQRDAVSDDTAREQYHTIFGFTTSGKTAAIAIDIVYWFIIFVAYCFAFHALEAILITWHWVLISLASLAVVGLPYCVKIILFGRKQFPFKAAVLCLFLSLLPTIFDFAGLYSETGVQDSLKTSKSSIVETLSYFEAESKKSVQNQEQEIRNDVRNKKETIEHNLFVKVTDTKRQIEDANQEVIDERQGVKGKAGDGPRARELQAEVRKLQAQAEIEQQSAKIEIKKQFETLDSQIEDNLKSLKQSSSLLGDRIVSCKKDINNAHSFKELETEVINANSLISTIASTLNIKFEPIKITGTDNIIKVSFTALTMFDITALVCFLLAVLMEIGDIIITYTMRYEPKIEIPAITSEELKEHRYKKYTKTYEGY